MAAAVPRRCLDSRPRVQLIWFLLAVGFAVDLVRAQTPNATTDPVEARALNTILGRWGISAPAQWNISGELCSGAAIDPNLASLNPGIKCNCDYNNGTTCHITHLKVFQLDVPGLVPDELWNLTYLTDLNLGQNYLTGPLSPSIGRLTDLMYLSVGPNALSGEIPKELGMLTNLRSLGLSVNNFSGPLPSELGNLTRLTQLYLDTAGVRGPIPVTFARLRNLERVWVSDNELTGQIPEFIGNWSNLVQLRCQGNSFQGPIPQSFSSLTSLTDLRLSDLYNANRTSLNFLRNMTSLFSLVLRNNKISGPIPSDFGSFQSTKLLDLSFNNLTGTIPDSLFNLSSLTHLYLGSNKLTGALPSQKNPLLQYIDLSYNELSGSIPTWLSEQNLQLNLVANNFSIDSSNGSALPSGLYCLQRNFPCRRGSPIYSSFAVKCGGLQITTADQVVYESDNETLGPATYYMTGTRRWAVSNAGADSENPRYTTSTLMSLTNTSYTDLFRTARVSAGSLRYYGLGLENGNYTVTLQFAEFEIVESRSWRSLGRRVFDIYLQGKLEVRDFAIRREAGGESARAVVRPFTVEVLENYIEIHLFWAGKGTTSVPIQGTYGPSISAISATPDFNPTVSNNPASWKKNHTALIGKLVPGVVAASVLCLIAVCFVLWRRMKQRNFEDEELSGIDTRPNTFSYAELRAATGDFNPSNKLGEGGFGPVYKGTLGDGRVVAVKQLSAGSRQGKSQFIAEIATISAVQHRNLVKLYGCCIQGEKRLLVYEYLKNKSLDKLLFGTGSKTWLLDWKMRFNICLGVAKGLAYLHEDSRVRIVHRDVKASNILLDYNLTPKISDFGLAKLYEDEMSHISTRVAGTIGYLAPEYAMFGHLTEKADVFSFGIVALEIVSGRPCSNPSLQDDMICLLELAWELHEQNKEINLVNSSLHEYNADEATRIISVALLCTQAAPALRPAMSRVVAMLSGDIEVGSIPMRPAYLTDWRFTDHTTFFMSLPNDSSTFVHEEVSSINNNSTTLGAHLHSPDADPANPNLHMPSRLNT